MSRQADNELRDRLIDDVCRMLNVRLSHWDPYHRTNWNPHSPAMKPLKLPSCAIVFSERYGSWQILIMQDMSIVRPMDAMKSLSTMSMDICRQFIKHKMDMDGEYAGKLKKMQSEVRKEQRLRKKVKDHLIAHDGIRLFATKPA